MNLETITMDRIAAREAFHRYRDAVKARHTKEDEALMHGYRALAKGKQIIDLHSVMRATGRDALMRPRLAICRADATTVHYDPWYLRFSAGDRMAQKHRTRSYVQLPNGLWPASSSSRPCRAVVPLIPPQFRPATSLDNYHVLWEADWQDVPGDPFLLRHLHGPLYAVLAQWDLSPIERAVLRGRLG